MLWRQQTKQSPIVLHDTLHAPPASESALLADVTSKSAKQNVEDEAERHSTNPGN